MSRDRTWVLVAAIGLAAGGFYLAGPRAPRSSPSPPPPELPAVVLAADASAAASFEPVPVELRGPRMWLNVGLYFSEPPKQPLATLVASKSFRVVEKMPPTSPADAVVEAVMLQLDREQDHRGRRDLGDHPRATKEVTGAASVRSRLQCWRAQTRSTMTARP